MNITVIGCGYVGLVSGTCLAALGHRIIAVDVDQARVAALRQGKVPIYEPGLSELIQAEVKNGRLSFTTDTAAAVAAAETIFIAVGTPPAPEGGYDMTMLFAAAKAVAAAANGPKTLVIKSTVPPGTGDQVEALVKSAAHPMEVANNPEFLREGTAIQDFMQPDRIIFGAGSNQGLAVLREIYQPLIDRGYSIFSMGRQSAELTKFAANAMLAMRISFINELSQLATAVGADIESVRMGIGSDKRIGPAFLKAGVGYGGSCFPKDVAALVHQMRRLSLQPHLLEGIEKANQRQKVAFSRRILDVLAEVKHPHIAVWGLAFKADTDDVREAPAFEIVRALLAGHATVSVYDPQAMPNSRVVLKDTVRWCDNLEQCTRGADAVALITDWPVFVTVDWHSVKQWMRGLHVFDGRNCLASGRVAAAGLHYYAIGRPEVKPGAGRQGSVGVISAG